MKQSMRPHRIFAVVILSAGAALAVNAVAQSRSLVRVLQETSPLLLGHSSSQGYLGVDLADVDNDKAQVLKLKEVRGAIITLIDHDAPAGQVGLHVNDVVVKLNGQTVESAEQFRRMLRELPAGRKISLEISRDGNLQTLNVQLADRHAMEQAIWNRIGHGGSDDSGPGMGMMSTGDVPLPGGFHMPSFSSGLNVGALVEPLTSQMAEYLGVANGLMVKQITHKSEAAAAGLKAFDVILKVGAEPINTLSDWDRALRSNQGKPVQVTILRDKKQQVVTLQVDSKRHQGEMEELPDEHCPELAAIDPGVDLDQMRQQLDQLKQNLQQLPGDPSIPVLPSMELRFPTPPQELLQKHWEEILRQEMEQMKRQMEVIKAMGLGDHV